MQGTRKSWLHQGRVTEGTYRLRSCKKALNDEGYGGTVEIDDLTIKRWCKVVKIAFLDPILGLFVEEVDIVSFASTNYIIL